MASPLASGDGLPIIQGYDSRFYHIPETASSEYAPYLPCTAVQPISTSTSSTEERSHSKGSISHLQGLWFSPTELTMTSLFHFEDKVHLRNLS